MFWGDCQFKTPMPPNVMARGYITYIKSKTAVLFDNAEVPQIVTAIKEGMLPKTWATRRQHVVDLKKRFNSTTTCPKCGNPLVLRTAKSGANAGSQFYGCTKYPACRYVGKVKGQNIRGIEPPGTDHYFFAQTRHQHKQKSRALPGFFDSDCLIS